MPNIWTRQIDLFFNIDRTPGAILLKDLSGQSPAPRPAWVEADKFLARLWFLKPSGNFGSVADVYTLGDGDGITLSGKAAGTLLFCSQDWAPVIDAGITHYEALVDLNTVALLAAVTTQAIVITAEIEVRNNDNSQRLSGEFDLQLLPQVYAGESNPTPATPLYPAAVDVVTKAPALGGYRFKSDGAGGSLFQVKSATSGKFHSLLVSGAPGAEALTIGPPEV